MCRSLGNGSSPAARNTTAPAKAFHLETTADPLAAYWISNVFFNSSTGSSFTISENVGSDFSVTSIEVSKSGRKSSYACAFAAVKPVIEGTNIKLGAQNMHWKESGAYTGELSAAMLKECGVEYVILGHSERRQYFGETDATVNLRTLAAVKAGLTPIICVGEKKEEREAGYTNALVVYQTLIALTGLTAEQVAKDVVIAYEPVWAIGTGLTATDEQANETIGVIREAIRGVYGDAADEVRIQYGGSMNPKNCKGLMAQPEIDGGLIGGASLKAVDFSQVVNFDK